MGLKPDGEPVNSDYDTDLKKNIPTDAQKSKRKITVKDVLKTHPFWLLYASTFSASMGVFIPFVHLMPFSKDLGFATSTGVMPNALLNHSEGVRRAPCAYPRRDFDGATQPDAGRTSPVSRSAGLERPGTQPWHRTHR